MEMLRARGLTYVCGGADAGGLQADMVLLESFSQLDKAAVSLQGQYATGERVVLMQGDRVTAAAVVQTHSQHGVMELP